MRILFVAILLIFSILAAGAKTVRLPAHTSRVYVNLRVAAPANERSVCEIRWLEADSLNYRFFSVENPGIDGSDETSGTLLVYSRGTCCEGRRTTSLKKSLRTSNSYTTGYSLRITATLEQASVEVGGDYRCFSEALPFTLDSLQAVRTEVSGDFKAVRDEIAVDSILPPRFVGLDKINEQLEASRDINEGHWTYFDRNTDPLLSRLGGQYTVATVACGDGAYDIVLLGGAAEDAESWPPGRVKGHLTPTLIPGVYDLVWIQPDGQILSKDTSATFDGGHLLTLQFLRWKATVRLRRLTPHPNLQ